MNLRNLFYLILIASAVAVGVSLPGCGTPSEPVRVQAEPSEEAPPGVTLQILDYDAIQKLIAAHRGQVVVLDCWSTSCPPCVEEFPKLVALHKKYDPAQLACISLSFDFEGFGKPQDVQGEVLKFLEGHGATFENVLGAEPSDTLLKKIQLASIPAVFVYDRQGNVERFEGSKAYDQARELVEKLLNMN